MYISSWFHNLAPTNSSQSSIQIYRFPSRVTQESGTLFANTKLDKMKQKIISLVGPRDRHVLLPPPASDVGHVEAEDEAEGYEIDEGVAVDDDLLEGPLLLGAEYVAVEGGDGTEQAEKHEELPVDELVEGASPHEEETGEAAAGGAGDLILIRDRHPVGLAVLQKSDEEPPRDSQDLAPRGRHLGLAAGYEALSARCPHC